MPLPRSTRTGWRQYRREGRLSEGRGDALRRLDQCSGLGTTELAALHVGAHGIDKRLELVGRGVGAVLLGRIERREGRRQFGVELRLDACGDVRVEDLGDQALNLVRGSAGRQ